MLASSNHHHYTPMEICPMDEPLFDEDWLHEHNLDILFDLFEEEVERKGLDNAAAAPATTNSSTIFGSSPVTSYLFGTSPPFASALDIYDLLYFDNNQQPISSSQQNQQHQQPQNSAAPNANSTTTKLSTTTSTATTTTTKDHTNSLKNPNIHQDNNNTTIKTYNVNGLANNNTSSLPTNFKQQQAAAGRNVTNSYLANSITNAMRIKRRFKKGQNEGVSLLAKPLSNNNTGGISGSGMMMMVNNNSDKNSTKLATTTTNLKKPNCNDNNSSTRSIDIKQSHHNRNRHLNHIHHNVHYMTGCSIIREHAYAVRGH